MRIFRAIVICSALSSAALCAFPLDLMAQAQKAASPSELQLRALLTSFEASGAKVTVGKITEDPINNRLIVESLVVASGDNAAGGASAELKIATLTLQGFSAENGGIRFERASADNVAIAPATAPTHALTISQLDISSSFLPSLASFKADPARPVSSQVSLLRLLSRSVIGAVRADKVSYPDAVAIEQFTLSGISNGKAAEADAASLTFSLPSVADTTDTGTKITSSFVALKNIDIDPYIRLFEDSAYLEAGSSKPWSNLIQALVVKNFSFQRGASTVRIEEASLGALRVRQFGQNLTDIFDKSALDRNFLANTPDAAAKITEAVRQAFSLEAAGIKGVEVSIPNQGGAATIVLQEANLANLTANHLDQLRLDRFSIVDSGGEIRLQQLVVGDIATPNVASRPQSNSSAGIAVPTVGSLNASQLTARIDAMNFGLDKLDVVMSYFIGSAPTNVRATVDHLRFSANQITIPNLKQVLSDLGYSDIDLSLKVSGAWQDAASALAFDNIALTGAEMGTLSLSGSLTGITRASFEAPTTALSAEALSGGVQSLRLSFENGSLFERFIEQAAKQNAKSPDELKRILSANMSAILGQIQPAAARNKFTLAVVSFINNPKVLEIAATTSDITPVKDVLAAIAEPYKLPALLKLDASANARR